MDHGKRRSAYRSAVEAEQLDLGNEPPLSVDGGPGGLIDRRRVSVQWFSGTILTGLCGAALMGGAVFAALDGQTNFATVPERVGVALRAAGNLAERLVASTRKGDRLPAAGEASNHRQVIRISATTRVGNREVVRVRPFVRVSGNLSLSVTELSAGIPPFNPQKMMLADGGPEAVAPEEAPEGEIDAEVSFVTRDLSPVLPRAKLASAAVVPMDDIIVAVRDAANWTGSLPPARYATASIPTDTKFAYAADGDIDPYIGMVTRIAPENITLLPKTTAQTTGGNDWTERVVALKKGDTVGSTLRDLGAKPEDIKQILSMLGSRRDGAVKEGQKLRVLLAPTDDKRVQPIRVILGSDTATDAIVALSDSGKYVAVDVRSVTEVARAKARDDEEEDDGSGVRLYQSLYETALRRQVPRPVIDDLIRIYSYDVDFQRKVQPGDSFEVLFAGEDETSEKNDVLFAALTANGETKRFYRYQSNDDGLVDYYDETGKSAKKFLVRKPAAEGIMRSGFGERSHPLLHYTRMHTGVDWAAPMGTPIYASGNGEIEKIGWEGGYGRYIRVRHANGYETGYGHMSAFARGMEVGKKVRQGQVIGYVGSTGLSTGAHLHYEILINGRFVDPMKVKLPRGRVLDGPLLANFEQERDRMDNMMTRNAPVARAAPAPRVAQTIDR